MIPLFCIHKIQFMMQLNIFKRKTTILVILLYLIQTFFYGDMKLICTLLYFQYI